MAGKRISITVAAPVVDLIDRCLETGLYGDNRADVLRFFIRRGIEDSGAIHYLDTSTKER